MWLLGIGNAVFGLVGGFLVLPLPQLLAAQGVPESRIALISSACFSPAFFVFALGPILDIRFSRRTWAAFFGLLAGIAMAAAIALRAHLLALEAGLIVSYSAASMSSNALGGWLSDLVPANDHNGQIESSISAWTQVAVFLGNGLMAILAGELLRHASTPVAATALGLLAALPVLAFAFIPVPATERRLPLHQTAATFRAFATEVKTLVRKRSLWLTFALFVLPTGSFALTNQLSAVAGDFHASPDFVSRIGGLCLTLAGGASCLLVPVLARKMRPLTLYLGIGLAGSLFTVMLLAVRLNNATFALAFLGENCFQAMSFTAAVAICLAVIGRENPLAGTTFGLLTAVTVVPTELMGVLDGHVYTTRGLYGMLGVDGLLSLSACLVMLTIITRSRLARA